MAAVKSLWTFPKIIAHRGCGTLAPENTLGAIETGMKVYGYRAVEFDVMLTKDRVPVLMHDHKLGRTVTQGNDCLFTACRKRWISDLSWDELKSLDAGSWLDNEKFAGYRVPLFEDVLKYCKENGIWMNIEIKPVPGYETITGEIVAELTKKYFPSAAVSTTEITTSHSIEETDRSVTTTSSATTPGANDNENDSLLQSHASTSSITVTTTYRTPPPLFSSFSAEALLAAKKVAPHIDRAFLIKATWFSVNWRKQLDEIDAVSLNLQHDFLSDKVYEEIKSYRHKESNRELFILCYTVNDPARAKVLIDMGVDAIFTDRVDLFDFIPGSGYN